MKKKLTWIMLMLVLAGVADVGGGAGDRASLVLGGSG